MNKGLEAARLAPRKPRKKTPSLRASINAMCKNCIYEEGSGGGTWRQQVAACTAPKCPLFAVRPMPKEGSQS